MKKSLAIAMLALLLFNQGGYVLLFQYNINQSDAVMDSLIGKDRYKDSELVEIKIPVNLPSVNYSNEYQSIKGQVKLNGQCYNYVKLKVSMDTMYLKVIPNHEKTRLVNAKVKYVKQLNDIPVSKKSNIPATKKAVTDNECNYIAQYKAKLPVVIINTTVGYTSVNVIDPSLDVPGQPPEARNTLS